MAESLVTLSLESLASFSLAEEGRLSSDIREDLTCIEDELERLKPFLKAADVLEDNDKEIKVWNEKVREVAYATQDLVDEFKSRLNATPQFTPFYHSLPFQKRRHKKWFASQFKDIKDKISNIADGPQIYRHRFQEHRPSANNPDIYEKGRPLPLVGIDKQKKDLIRLFLRHTSSRRQQQLKVISVVGICGIGKTTLVEQVYMDAACKQFWPKAWISINLRKDSMVEDVLKDILKQILVEGKEKGVEAEKVDHSMEESGHDQELKKKIHDYLGDKRYLIVLDDVREKHVWDSVKDAMPNTGCIILTTRKADVAPSSGNDIHGILYYMKPLSQEDCRTLFRGSEVSKFLKAEEKIHQNIIVGCNGIPLAILEITGHLCAPPLPPPPPHFNNPRPHLTLPIKSLRDQYTPSLPYQPSRTSPSPPHFNNDPSPSLPEFTPPLPYQPSRPSPPPPHFNNPDPSLPEFTPPLPYQLSRPSPPPRHFNNPRPSLPEVTSPLPYQPSHRSPPPPSYYFDTPPYNIPNPAGYSVPSQLKNIPAVPMNKSTYRPGPSTSRAFPVRINNPGPGQNIGPPSTPGFNYNAWYNNPEYYNSRYNSAMHNNFDAQNFRHRYQKLIGDVGAVYKFYDQSIHLHVIKRDFLSSYDDLPCRLKFCLLYVSLFPDFKEVDAKRLMRYWIAEGLVEKEEGKTIEKVAEGYLQELVRRFFLQIDDKQHDGRVKKCSVPFHFFRYLISRKSKELALIESEGGNCRGFRRLSIKNGGSPPPTGYCSSLRLLVHFGVNYGCSTLASCTSEMKLLRVLDLRGDALGTFPEQAVNMYHLKYISLRDTRIESIPTWIGNLKNLETLELKNSGVKELPAAIYKLQKLRHLLVYSHEKNSSNQVTNFRYQDYKRQDAEVDDGIGVDRILGVKAPAGIGGLLSLEKLSYIEAGDDNELIEELSELDQLRRLRIMKLKKSHGTALSFSLRNLNRLVSLHLQSVEAQTSIDLRRLYWPVSLQHLYVWGKLENPLPNRISCLHNLSVLSLRFCKLNEDPLERIAALPNLIELHLVDAYDGEQLHFKAGSFLKLEFLWLAKLGIKSFQVEQGAMPNLVKLEIVKAYEGEEFYFKANTFPGLASLRLAKLPVKCFQVEEDALPNLLQLEIDRAYEGEEFNFKANTFPNLEYFKFAETGRLKTIKVETEALPDLKAVHLKGCQLLRKASVMGIDHKIIQVTDMPKWNVVNVTPS